MHIFDTPNLHCIIVSWPSAKVTSSLWCDGLEARSCRSRTSHSWNGDGEERNPENGAAIWDLLGDSGIQWDLMGDH